MRENSRGFYSPAESQTFIKLQYWDRAIFEYIKLIYPLWVFGVNGWGEVEKGSALKPL